ncbi:MAG TPA: GntR family transcriptional regulator [Micromonosporaceae bacterium]|nr:GntR family transcriptional regulator [Micromonosporaceae bacterium]
MTLAPRESLREEITKSLRAAIIAGQLRPGTVYTVPTLAAQYGVSPTPVREAILDLAKEGLISIAKNKGFRVSALSDAELDQITEIRALLEIPTVGALTGKLTSRQIDLLREQAQAIVTAAEKGDLASYLQTDTIFHTSLLGFGGNGKLVELVTDLRNRTRLYGLDTLVHTGGLVDSAAEHLEMVALLEKGNAAKVSELMRRHLSHVRGIWASRPES